MKSSQYKLFLDLDGVLVNFNEGVEKVTGKHPSHLTSKMMWSSLARTPRFFERLGWMPDGLMLWEATRHLSPHILTGLPHGPWAEPQKRAWCARELGPEIPVSTCLSRDKAMIARGLTAPKQIPLLVDDRTTYQDLWEAMGGVYIVHRSTESSLARLRELSVIL